MSNAAQLCIEFDRQVDNLIAKDYPTIIGITAEAFLTHIEPLKSGVRELAAYSQEPREGYIPFVIVITSELATGERTMPLVERQGRRGVISMYPVAPTEFAPIDDVRIPPGGAYLLVDIDRGKETINITPDDALDMIKQDDRSPLTIDEGIAILTHYPAFLQKNNCFSLLASRCGDRRVPALWLSAGRPKLGWCWAGNPHTWLGSASCSRRICNPRYAGGVDLHVL
jgi:hypothetical protein